MFKLSDKHGCFQYAVPRPEGEAIAEIGSQITYQGQSGVITHIHKKHLFQIALSSGETVHLWRLEFQAQKSATNAALDSNPRSQFS